MNKTPVLDKVKKPSLLIDKAKVLRNLERMNFKAKHSGVIFRPHFKTHQSLKAGAVFREIGINKITVSSVDMAKYFADSGWEDITIAFIFNLRQMEEVNKLASQIKLNILVEDEFVINKIAESAVAPIGVFIKIDNGYNRTGVEINKKNKIDSILEIIEDTKNLIFKGFLTHAGNTYHAKSKEEILGIKKETAFQLNNLKKQYISNFPNLIISYGDTPSCSIAQSCNEFDEIRPGNFVYYDIMQYHLGSCKLNDIAVVVACPVVAMHPERNEMVIYGGAVHLSKEMIAGDNHFTLYGYVVTLSSDGKWDTPINGAYVSSLSQEHGIIKMPPNQMEKFKPGDVIGILPVHSCLTANLITDQYWV